MSDKRTPEKKKKNQSGAVNAKNEKPKTDVFMSNEEQKNRVNKPNEPMKHKNDNKSKRKP